MQSACREASVLAEEKHLRFGWSVPDDPLKVWGDSTSLERLFVILLDNAVKYTASGGHVDVCLRSDDGFAVADVCDIEAHGGQIRVESKLGAGSTFKIRIPLSTSDPSWESPSNPV